MLRHKLSLFAVVSCGLALPARPATFNYFLQVSGQSPTFAPYSVSWSSNSLINPPPCGGPGHFDVSKQPGFTITSSPILGLPPLTTGGAWSFCSSAGGGAEIITYWADALNELGYFLNFPASNPPVTTGVFTAPASSDLLCCFFPPPDFYEPGPPATLTITKSLSFPPIPVWFLTEVHVSLTVAGPVTPPPGTPVEAIVGFVNQAGISIGQPVTVPLVAGQVSPPAVLKSSLVVNALGQHAEIVPVVTAPPGQSLPPLQLTAEILDRVTGFGSMLTTTTGLAPPPATLAPQGLAFGQIMRLTAAAFPTDPCDATLSFANSEGTAVGPSLTVNLSPGQSHSLDLTSAALKLTPGHSIVIQPIVALQPIIGTTVVSPPACMLSTDVFDVVLGRTWTYQTANVQ